MNALKKCPLRKEQVVEGYKKLPNPSMAYLHRSKAGVIYEDFMNCIEGLCMAWDEGRETCNFLNKLTSKITIKKNNSK